MLYPFVIYNLESGVDLRPISRLVYMGTSVKKEKKAYTVSYFNWIISVAISET